MSRVLWWGSLIFVAVLSLNGLLLVWMVVNDAWRTRRERRELMARPDAEVIELHQHIRVTASRGRIDWPLDLPLARNGDTITIEHEEEIHGPGDRT